MMSMKAAKRQYWRQAVSQLSPNKCLYSCHWQQTRTHCEQRQVTRGLAVNKRLVSVAGSLTA